MYSKISSCPQCGASIYAQSPWFGGTPPPPLYTCDCVYSKFTTTHTNTTYKNEHNSLNDCKNSWRPFSNEGNKVNKQNIKNGQQALEELFNALEESKNNDLKEATESLKDAFEKNNVIKEPTDKEKILIKKIELLESNLKTFTKELGQLKNMLK